MIIISRYFDYMDCKSILYRLVYRTAGSKTISNLCRVRFSLDIYGYAEDILAGQVLIQSHEDGSEATSKTSGRELQVLTVNTSMAGV